MKQAQCDCGQYKFFAYKNSGDTITVICSDCGEPAQGNIAAEDETFQRLIQGVVLAHTFIETILHDLLRRDPENEVLKAALEQVSKIAEVARTEGSVTNEILEAGKL